MWKVSATQNPPLAVHTVRVTQDGQGQNVINALPTMDAYTVHVAQKVSQKAHVSVTQDGKRVLPSGACDTCIDEGISNNVACNLVGICRDGKCQCPVDRKEIHLVGLD